MGDTGIDDRITLKWILKIGGGIIFQHPVALRYNL
jgi:hypothetical protein